MKKLLVLFAVLGVLSFGGLAYAETAGDPTPITTSAEGDVAFEKIDEKHMSWKESISKGKIGYGHGFKTSKSPFEPLWFIGWLFTIGYLGLKFWEGVLALIIWPYYIGKHFTKKENKE